jgi:MraZ protein
LHWAEKGCMVVHMEAPYLVGRFEHTLDDKGRVTLPARYRELFSDEVYISPSLHGEHCVHIYYAEAWRAFVSRYLDVLDEFNDAKASRRVGKLLDKTTFTKQDRQGRIGVPSKVVESLGLSGTVRLVGHRDHLELWDPEAHDAWLAEEGEDGDVS